MEQKNRKGGQREGRRKGKTPDHEGSGEEDEELSGGSGREGP